MFKQYLKNLLQVARQGDAREESYYGSLKTLLEDYASSTNKKNIHITMLPKNTDAGNPDFRIWDGTQKIVGYMEAKTPNKNLDEIEKTEQIERYRSTFPNFILTNFFEFRLFKNGLIDKNVRIANPIIIHSFKGMPQVENEERLKDLLERFFVFTFPKITSAEPLAKELAKRTRFLRDEVIAQELREEGRKGIKKILGFYEAFQTYLIRGLTEEQFADLYSQTITYGLFASRMRCEGKFNRKLAAYDIPHSIGILREMFEFLSWGDLSPQLEWIVDDISNVLANVNVRKIFSEFFRNKRGEDPVYHFYETFLAEYDPEERERRGVYYTPSPVVSYIVRSLDLVLKTRFDLEDGLASNKVTILDPAAGTLTFVAETIKQAIKEFTSKYGDGGKRDFAREHILKNFYAFELMIAPYCVGHLKASFLLEEMGYKLLKDDRFKFFLTNTLELEDIEQTALPAMASLAEESRNAGDVKNKIPIIAIIGNPPYSGISANRGEWITNLIEDYKHVNGKPLNEKNPKWLQDDYVKFIRFAEWKINQVENGVIGYITNHSYLDNPTFRGMRQNLIKTFDEIFILDLHGNSLKKEKCPDGSKDENVFDIRQGVAISFFIKNSSGDCSTGKKVFHSEVWGIRDKKYEWLLSNGLKTTEWKEIHPHSPFYFLVPKEEKHLDKYETFWDITDKTYSSSVGLITARDRLAIKLSPSKVWQTVKQFAKMDSELARETFELGKDVSDWTVKLAQKDLADSGLKKKGIVPILYRPFDIRYTYYTGKSRGFHCRPRPKFMKHFLRDNLALCVGRAGQVVGQEKLWNLIYCSEHMMDLNLFYRGGSMNLPLYLYSNGEVKNNIKRTVFQNLENAYGTIPIPEQIFHYIYAVLYSKLYRKKYAEFLETDYPKVPFTSDYNIFVRTSKLGKQLMDLHLMKSEKLSVPITKFQGEGDSIIEKPRFKKEKQQVYINKTQFFEEINEKLWEYQIGGYQILLKWLKDRKGKRLSLEDIKHYCKMATAIQKTMEIQNKIDSLYPEIEKEIIVFKEDKPSLEKYTN